MNGIVELIQASTTNPSRSSVIIVEEVKYVSGIEKFGSSSVGGSDGGFGFRVGFRNSDVPERVAGFTSADLAEVSRRKLVNALMEFHSK